VFSGNQAISGDAYGGAIYNAYGTMSVKACTFYNNSTTHSSGAISGSDTTLTGNLFYGNTARSGYPVVTGASSTGYNVVDVPLGYGTTQSGWPIAAGDISISIIPVSSVSFRLLSGSGAANVIDTLPEGFLPIGW
jgi:hypothetical protein